MIPSEWEVELREKYPLAMRRAIASSKAEGEERIKTGWCSAWSPEGWKPIVERCLEQMEKVLQNMPEKDREPFEVVQIKEKWAGLCVYVDGLLYLTLNAQTWVKDTDKETPVLKSKIDTIIKTAQAEASQTCQDCGSKDEVTICKTGLFCIKRLCITCFGDQEAELLPSQLKNIAD